MVGLSVEQIEQRVKKKRQEIEGGQEGCQRLRPMAKVVFKMIPLRFEGIVVFILDFPAGAARRHEGATVFAVSGACVMKVLWESGVPAASVSGSSHQLT